MATAVTENNAVSENNDLVAKLLNKPRNSASVKMQIGDDVVEIKFEAISNKAYDKLLSDHPPKADQRIEGSTYDINTFGPALLAACAVSPTLTTKQATDLWNAPSWSRGEAQTLFAKAVEVNFSGASVPFSAQD